MAAAFDIYMSGTWRLPLDHIWPDGDAPENPTAEDVLALLPDDSYSQVRELTCEWNLVPDIQVRPV